jgi:4-amino-4-deoxy-L-arabinose transferase-like glycosyltransferase/membrane-associated phospholipid phosphatase
MSVANADLERRAPRARRFSSLRRIAPLLAAAALACGALAVTGLDEIARGPVAGRPVLRVVEILRVFGKTDVLAVVLFVAGACGALRRARLAIVALLVTAMLVVPVKALVGRERPNDSRRNSFPSGDTASAAALAVTLAAGPTGLPVALLAAGTLVIGAGRIADGKHFPSDVLAGAAFGLVAGWLALRLIHRLPLAWLGRRAMLVGAAAIVAARVALFAVEGVGADEFRMFLGAFGVPLVLVAGIRLWSRDRARAAPDARTVVALTLLAVAVVYGLVIAGAPLWDRDEPRYARATLEMLESGNLLYPTFAGKLRAEKPILIYWLMALPVRAFGPLEAAFRAWAPIGAALSAMLVFVAGRRSYGPLAGALGGAMLVATPLLFVSGTAATTDAVLLAFITAALLFLLRPPPSWGLAARVLATGLALGGALLTKGPVGIAVPALAATLPITWAWQSGDRGEARRIAVTLVAATLLGCALFLAWGVPANNATGGRFFALGIGENVVRRSITPFESHGGFGPASLLFYPAVLLFGFFPWVAFVPAAASAFLGGRLGSGRDRALVAGWALMPVALMTAVATKLPHYVLPAWPAFALGCSAAVTAAARGAFDDRDRRWLARGRYLLWVAAAAWAALPLALFWHLPLPLWCAVPGSLSLVVMALFASRALGRGEARRAAGAMFAGMAAFGVALGLFAVPAAGGLTVSRPLARAVVARVPADAVVATFEYDEPSLRFYLGTRSVTSLPSPDAVAAWTSAPGPRVIVLPRDRVGLLPRELNFTEVAAARGWSSRRRADFELVALCR